MQCLIPSWDQESSLPSQKRPDWLWSPPCSYPISTGSLYHYE